MNDMESMKHEDWADRRAAKIFSTTVSILRRSIEPWIEARRWPNALPTNGSPSPRYESILCAALLQIAVARSIRRHGIAETQERMKACFDDQAHRYKRGLN